MIMKARLPTAVQAQMMCNCQVCTGEKGTLESKIGVNLARMSQRAMTEGKSSRRRNTEENRPVKTVVGGVVVRAERGAPLGALARRR